MDQSGLSKGVFRPLSRVSAGLLAWSRPHDTRTMFLNSSAGVLFLFLPRARPPSVFPFCSF
ncbi:hypothetical protein LMG18101_05243 [Ralstonia flaminis]|uniref:Uncharacterized protein n=1 Tax=Ralstonia flaminis TaxID=3058597 RepID=A0ABM9KBM8_9RALS|nr:hypothetical protein LMG18101_05243 [Ralstonia sp. LMG 18101]